jgi:hypothetical protein
MPAQQRRWRNEKRMPTVALEQSTGRAEENPIEGPDDGPRYLTPQHRGLVPQNQNLEFLGVI